METKICCDCGNAKSLDEFARRSKSGEARHSKCKACQRAYAKAHYAKNKGAYLQKTSLRNAEVRAQYTQVRDAFLQTQVCSECGSRHDLQLESGGKVRPAHEVIGWVSTPEALAAALAESGVRCRSCIGRELGLKYGHIGRAAAVRKSTARMLTGATDKRPIPAG